MDELKTIDGGLFLVFEGGEGTGKSTQAVKLANWIAEALRYDSILTREPGGSVIGKKIRKILLDDNDGDIGHRAEALLFAADRAHHVEHIIRPAMKRGTIVICDRYEDSTIAYQGVARELGVPAIRDMSRWASEGLVPDLTVLLDMDPQAARARRAADTDRIEAEPLEFHQRVRGALRALADQKPTRYLVLDAARPQDDVTFDIRIWVMGLIGARTGELLPEVYPSRFSGEP